jgi:hypothetical protein
MVDITTQTYKFKSESGGDWIADKTYDSQAEC